MIHLPQTEIQWWLDINIRLAEFCGLHLRDQQHSKKLYNILKGSEDTWYKLLIRDFQIEEDGLLSFLQSLYHRDIILFCQIFALKKFSDTIISPDLIVNKAKNVLGEDFRGYEILAGDDLRGLILPIFHRNRDALIDLYCDNVMKKSSIKTYNATLGFNQGHPAEITKESVQRLLNTFQRRKGSDRRPIHVMWVNSHQETIKIIFRKDKRSTTVIKKTSHNEAVKTADQKILVFTEGGLKLTAYLGLERSKTLEIAQYLAGKLFGRTIIFNEDIIKKPIRVLDRFIAALKQPNNSQVRVFGISAVNSPLTNFPTIEIRSRAREPINQNIIELSSPYGLHLLTNSSELMNAVVQIQEKKYKIHFEIEGQNVIIKCSDKGYNTEKKRIISDYFDSFNVDDTDANSS
jgi:hypothetical protein